MQREIKFRAWDKNKKKMFNVTVMLLASQEIDVDGNYNEPYHIDNFELMQFIGLKDKNGKGKEVYFGDIAKDKYGQVFEIVDNYKFLAHLEDIWFEIIGTRFENPELLEEKKK